MPPINPVIASAGIIAISAAVAAAIAIYESPEFRRVAEDVRRRIAIALHSIGDNIDIPTRADGTPLFNRPEDAEGFLQSRGSISAEDGVEADDESRRRQREELLYWNAIMEKKGAEKAESEAHDDIHSTAVASRSGLHADKSDGLRHRGGPSNVPAFASALYLNPFGDEHGIEIDEQHALPSQHDDTATEAFTDIYNATEQEPVYSRAASPNPASHPALIDIGTTDTQSRSNDANQYVQDMAEHEFMTTTPHDQQDAYTSIQAWAQHSHPGFYSPLPATPAGPFSETSDPEVISHGQLTPTGSGSELGSGVDLGSEVGASFHGTGDVRQYDVMSDDENNMPTPASWTEVGSVVSESEDGRHATRA